MATTVSNILTQIKAIAAAQCGANWHELPSVLNLATNDARRGSKGYGARPLAASETPSVTNSYALDHQFEVVLMDRNPKQGDDSQAMAVIVDLYDKQDEIFKAMARSKLSLPGVVILVSQPVLPEPETVNGGEFIALKQQFNVRYRQVI